MASSLTVGPRAGIGCDVDMCNRRPLTILSREYSECRNACGRAKIAGISECSVGSQSRADRCQLGAAPHRAPSERGRQVRTSGGAFLLRSFPIQRTISRVRWALDQCVLLVRIHSVRTSACCRCWPKFRFLLLSPAYLLVRSPALCQCGPRWPLRDSGRPVGRREGQSFVAVAVHPWPSPARSLEKYLPSAHPFLLTFTYLPPLFRSTGKHASSHGGASPAWPQVVTHALRYPSSKACVTIVVVAVEIRSIQVGRRFRVPIALEKSSDCC